MKPKTKAPDLYSDIILSRRADREPPRPREGRRQPQGHKFSVGQILLFSPSVFETVKVKGSYSVVSLLPADNGDNQYRLKSSVDGHERVVRESQLTVSP